MKKLIIISCVLLLTACSSSKFNSKYGTRGSEKAPAVYDVKKGDSLFSIAWRFGLDPKTIQHHNNISDPNKIYVGQSLRLRYSADQFKNSSQSSNNNSATATNSINTPKVIANWVWPINGSVAREFNPNKIGSNGIRIAGHPNQTVNATEAGTIAYKGNGLNGYGNVVIIKHKNGLLSAYGFLSKTYVKEGQKVKKRQRIGTVGYAANKQLMLHFEVRRNGTPVNPKAYIGNTYHF